MACTPRIGLLVLGYIKLLLINIPHAVTTGVYLYSQVLDYIKYREYGASWYLIPVNAGMELYSLLDLCFCVTLLVAAHKRDRGLLRVNFWSALVFGFISVIITTSSIAGNIFTMITNPHLRDMMLRNVYIYIGALWYGIVHTAMQISILVLVSKEMKNLRNNERSAGSKIEVQAATGAGETELRDV